MATDRLINKDQGDSMISALGTIATNVGNITYGPQTSADKVVAMTGYAKAETVAAISQGDTLNEAVGKLEKKADDNATAITGKTAGPESATVGDIATFNNMNGKVLNDSGISIQTSVDDTKDTEVPTSKAVGTYITGKGYATGVATSTANHLVTFNGTDGKALKDGGATIAFNTTGVLDDDTAVPTSKAVQSYVTGKHYAGSSSDGGAATSADKLNIGNSNIGSATQPVYFDKTTGKPVAITNTIQSNVPANAVFTDTTYTVAEGTANGKIKVTPSSGTAYEVPVHGLGNAAYKGVADTVSTSTDLVTSAAVNTKLASYVPNSDFVVAENNIKYAINTGVRNGVAFTLNDAIEATKQEQSGYPWRGNTFYYSSDSSHTVSFTVNDDCSITVNGSTTSAYNFMFFKVAKMSNFKNCVGAAYINNRFVTNADGLHFVLRGDGSTANVVFDDGTDVPNDLTNYSKGLTIRIDANKSFDNVRIYPLISPKTVFEADNTYKAPALPNSDLTVFEAEDRASLAEVVDAGAKNLLPNKGQMSHGDVTFTWNNDGSVTISGTKTAGAECYVNVIDNVPYSNMGLKAGDTIVLSNNGTNAYISVIFWASGSGYTSAVTAVNETKPVILPTDKTNILIRLTVKSDVASVSETIKPMICTKAAFGVSSKFVPYRPNWDLVANSVWKYSELRYTNTAANEFQNTGVSFTVPANRAVEFYAYDRKDAAYLDSIVVCDSESNLSTQTTTIVSINKIGSDGFTDSQYWTLQTTGIIPTYNAAVTYYVWVKRRSTGSNPVGLAYRFIS